MELLIANGRVIDPANGFDEVTDLYVSAGKIESIGKAPRGFRPKRVIDAGRLVVSPGLVDLSARLGGGEDEHGATIVSETQAAARAGITTLCCPPDTTPVLDIPAVAELIHRRAQQAGLAKVRCLGALTRGLGGEQLAEMYALKAIGCVGVSNAGRAVYNTEVMRRALEYAGTCGLPVVLQPEDHWLGRLGYMHEGGVSTRLGIPGIPETAETVALSRDLLLVEQTGVRTHFARLSTAKAVELLAQAQTRGLPVSADVTIHHLHLTHDAVGDFDSMCYVRPPFRTEADRKALRAAVARGVIAAVCSDHQPHDVDAKTAPFGATEPGVSALELLLPLTLELVRGQVLDLSTAIAAITCRAARVLAMQAGTLAIGASADVCVFDPERRWTVSEDTLLSAGKNSPFLGRELVGKVTHTLVDGHVVFDEEGNAPAAP